MYEFLKHWTASTSGHYASRCKGQFVVMAVRKDIQIDRLQPSLGICYLQVKEVLFWVNGVFKASKACGMT
jgi:hypothetical protein